LVAMTAASGDQRELYIVITIQLWLVMQALK